MNIKIAYTINEFCGFEDSQEFESFIGNKDCHNKLLSLNIKEDGIKWITFKVPDDLDEKNLNYIIFARMHEVCEDNNIRLCDEYSDDYIQWWSFKEKDGEYINLQQTLKI
jgi:hypothetical protein